MSAIRPNAICFRKITHVLFPAMFFFAAASAAAQQIPDDILRELRGQQGQTQRNTQSPVDRARSDTPLAVTPGGEIFQEIPAEPSRLELDYRSRSGDEELEQFGYNIFDRKVMPAELAFGRISDSYILGIDDEIIISFVGSVDKSYVTNVDREGRVVLPDLPPVIAAGRPFGEFSREFRARVASAMLGTEAFVSLGDVRHLGIFVLGEVEQPGLHNVTSLTSVLEALAVAGGVKKSGTLRNIRIDANGESRVVDLYGLMMSGAGADVRLTDGARIMVPTIGPNIAVIGEVIRPAIYELAPGESTIVAADLLEMAGGPLRPRGNRYTLNQIGDDGGQDLSGLSDLGRTVSDGAILHVAPGKNVISGVATLVGHVGVEGDRSLSAAPTLSALIGGPEGLGQTPYLLLGIIETKDTRTQSRLYKAVNLERVLAGAEDVELRDQDKVFVLSADDVRFLSDAAVRNLILTGNTPEKSCPALQELSKFVNKADVNRFTAVTRGVFVTDDDEGGSRDETAAGEPSAQPVRADNTLLVAGQPGVLSTGEALQTELRGKECSELFDEYSQLLPFVLEHAVSVTGAIRRPGVYPVAERTSLASVAAVAGGFANNADVSNIEVLAYSGFAGGADVAGRKYYDVSRISLSQVDVVVGSSVRFNPLVSDQESGSILLTGEFRRPGVYSIARGEKLSQLIERAGGLTDLAFPYGASLTRVSVKKAQEAGFRRTARELNNAMSVAVLRRDVSAEAILAAQQLTESLATVEAPGRVVIETDPAVLRTQPGKDTVLEPGDHISMPKRPNFVIVVGDVLNPGALQFEPGKGVEDYVDESGGLQNTADDDRVFVVYPNGVAEPVNISRWAFSSVQVPPGSTIVVPKDTSPLKIEFVRDIATIFSQLALSAASIAVISR